MVLRLAFLLARPLARQYSRDVTCFTRGASLVAKRYSSVVIIADRTYLYVTALRRYSSNNMTKKTAMVILAEGAEEMETIITIDVLRRAGIEVTVAGLVGKGPVKCARHTTIVPEVALADVKDHAFDAVVLPGGQPGSNSLAASDEVGAVLRNQHGAGRIVGAICAAPIALKSHGIATGSLVTSHPSVQQKLVDGGYKYSEDRVVAVGNVVTSRGPGTAFEFALKLVELLVGAEKVKEISAPMILKL